jgi:hypothetical protein
MLLYLQHVECAEAASTQLYAVQPRISVAVLIVTGFN